MSFISLFDLVKAPVMFLYQGKIHITTNICFLLSLLLFILLINSAVNSDFFYQKKPTISLENDELESYAEMVFDRSNFTIAAKVSDYTGVAIIDFSYFYFTMDFVQYDPEAEILSDNSKNL